MVDVSLITVSTDEADDLARCLASIDRDEHGLDLQILVVDNASTDGTAEVLARYPDLEVIRTASRKGYIENNNLAIARARGRYVLTMNADVVLEPGALAYMVAFMDRHPDAAVSACRLMFEDGTLQLTCRQFPTPLVYLGRLPHFFGWVPGVRRWTGNRIAHRYVMRDYDHRQTRAVDWVISAFFLMRRSVIEEIGPFAGYLRQPFYLEDVDWCFRAHLAGYRVYYVPEVWSTHCYRQTSVRGFNKLSLVHLANTSIFFAKHGLPMLLGRHRRSGQTVEDTP